MATYKNLRKVLNLPTLSESPSSGVNGEMYFNTTDSALYIYDGVWKKSTQSAIPFEFQGTEYLWSMHREGAGSNDYISKAAIASDGNWADTSRNNFQKTHISSTVSKSSTAAFVAGGYDATTTKVESFTFAGSANAVQHCALSNTASIYITAGATSMTSGYALGGYERAGPSSTTQVQKWIYSSNSDATLVGNLASHVRSNASAATQSSSNAYVCGGSGTSARVNSIQKWNFAAESTATNSGTLTSVKNYTAEASDINGAGYGYVAGGQDNSANLNVIERFAFASDGNASDVGDLTYACKEGAGHSSNTHGYVSEGSAAGNGKYQKYAFAASGNASAITATNQGGDPTGTQS